MEDVTSVNSTESPYIFWKSSSNASGDYSNVGYFLNNTNLTTLPPRPIRDESSYPTINLVPMSLSCICLIFSIAVYAILPEFKNVHGKNLISMSSSLLTTFLVIFVDRVVGHIVPFPVCFGMGMVIHVTFLATFFWTNVMAYDIWKSLTDLKVKKEVKSQSSKYLKYSIYAWTVSVMTAIPAAILNFTDWVPIEYRPKFGVNRRCWMNGTTAFNYYLNIPMGVVLLCNLILFVLTIKNLLTLKKMTAVFNIKQQQNRLYLYLKLFLVMGFTWLIDLLPCVARVYQLYFLSSTVTSLRGCFFFFVFVCRRKTLRNFYYIIRSRKRTSTES